MMMMLGRGEVWVEDARAGWLSLVLVRGCDVKRGRE